MNAIGSDTQELRRAAAQLDEMAASLHGSARGIHGLLFTTEWLGPFADGFRDVWSSRGRLYLNQAAAELEQAAAALRRNADEQDQASGSPDSTIPAQFRGSVGRSAETLPATPLDIAGFVAGLPGNPLFGALRDIKDWTSGIAKMGKTMATALGDSDAAEAFTSVAQVIGYLNVGFKAFSATKGFLESGEDWWKNTDAWADTAAVVDGFAAVGTRFSALNLGIKTFEATKGFLESGENWWKNTDAWADTASAVGSIVTVTVPPPAGTVIGGTLVAGAFIYEHREEIRHAVDTVVDATRHAVDDAAHALAPMAVDVANHTAEVVNGAVNAVKSFIPPWRH